MDLLILGGISLISGLAGYYIRGGNVENVIIPPPPLEEDFIPVERPERTIIYRRPLIKNERENELYSELKRKLEERHALMNEGEKDIIQ